MATYSSSLIHSIKGKIGGLVFYYHKGEPRIRIAQRTCPYKNLYKKAKTLSEKEARIFNHQLSLSFLGIFYSKAKHIIRNCWIYTGIILNSKKSPFNLFVSYNLQPFFNSIPRRDKILSHTNMPDLSKLLIVQGGKVLGRKKSSVMYDSRTGELKIKWETNQEHRESSDDEVNIGVLYLYPPRFKTKGAWKNMQIWVSNSSKREEGQTSLIIEKLLNAKYLHIWVFFSNKHSHSSASYCRVK